MSALGVLKQGTSSVVIGIAKGPSVRIVERAVRANAALTLRSVGETSSYAVSGRISSGGKDTLTLVANDIPAGKSIVVGESCFDAVFSLDGQEYLFGAEVIRLSVDEGGAILEITRPTEVQTWQRRKFIRATVADSAPVDVRILDDPYEPRFQGDILNVSADGLACRALMHDADLCTVGSKVKVIFGLESCEDIQCIARIQAKTPAGTENMVILGLQFIRDEMREKDVRALDGMLENFV